MFAKFSKKIIVFDIEGDIANIATITCKFYIDLYSLYKVKIEALHSRFCHKIHK